MDLTDYIKWEKLFKTVVETIDEKALDLPDSMIYEHLIPDECFLDKENNAHFIFKDYQWVCVIIDINEDGYPVFMSFEEVKEKL